MADDYEIMDLGEGRCKLVKDNDGYGVMVENGIVTSCGLPCTARENMDIGSIESHAINVKEHPVEGVVYTSYTYPEYNSSVPLDLYISIAQQVRGIECLDEKHTPD